MTFLTAATILVAWLGTDPGLASVPFPASGRSGELAIAATAELRPVRPQELFQGGSSRSLETQAALLLAEPMRIERELPVVWEMWLPKSWRLDRLLVEYEVLSPRGQPDHLGHLGRSDSSIELHLVPSPPEVVGEAEDRILVRGSLSLELDVNSLRFAGTYEGTLSVTVRQR